MNQNLSKHTAVSVPGEFVMLTVNLPPVAGTTVARSTGVVDFDKIKHLLSDKPLRHQKKHRELPTDDADVAEAEQLLAAEAGMAIPYEEARKNLELE